ncbi:hypothetical protein AVEN_135527-1 [Araneus ventricosus]|uniref:Uncharacterized protein n=1 Tax=Araneus ventricosus TaxID=182803 RepID=A0A4Y2HEC6_ARAVE|nr:hypothetical protein AVEN_135527-1 [Araneus ventricosus]
MNFYSVLVTYLFCTRKCFCDYKNDKRENVQRKTFGLLTVFGDIFYHLVGCRHLDDPENPFRRNPRKAVKSYLGGETRNASLKRGSSKLMSPEESIVLSSISSKNPFYRIFPIIFEKEVPKDSLLVLGRIKLKEKRRRFAEMQ